MLKIQNSKEKIESVIKDNKIDDFEIKDTPKSK